MKGREVLAAIKKRFWIIILTVLIAALAATLIARLQNPVYKVEVIMAATGPTNPTTKQPDPTVTLAYTASMHSIADASDSD